MPKAFPSRSSTIAPAVDLDVLICLLKNGRGDAVAHNYDFLSDLHFFQISKNGYGKHKLIFFIHRSSRLQNSKTGFVGEYKIRFKFSAVIFPVLNSFIGNERTFNCHYRLLGNRKPPTG